MMPMMTTDGAHGLGKVRESQKTANPAGLEGEMCQFDIMMWWTGPAGANHNGRRQILPDQV